MMMKKTLFTAISWSLFLSLSGQRLNVREEVQMKINTDFLITGETLYFSAFTQSMATGQPSPVSSILYVELVGKESTPVFQKKIQLKDGRGFGEFFVSSMVPTGTYQLLAYTKWMKNFGDYFQSSVRIINPFEPYDQPPKPNELSVTFAPESGAIVPGINNLVVFRSSEKAALTGRLINTNGEKVADLATNDKGYGRVVFNPQANMSYQAIFEGLDEQFYFFDLPKSTSNAPVIQLTNRIGSYDFKLRNVPDRSYQFQVTDGQNILHSEEVRPDQTSSIRKLDLNPGAYMAFVADEDVKARRLFFHTGDQKKTDNEIIATYAHRSLVNMPLELPMEANVAISVRKVDEQAALLPIDEQHQHSRLVQPISARSWLEADNQVAFASWKWSQPYFKADSVRWLPELRGELISGKIQNGEPGAIISYSILGEPFQLHSSKVDKDGRFMIRVDPVTGPHQAYVSVLGSDESEINLDDPFLEDYPPFDYTAPSIDSATAVMLAEKSIRNQIENAYYDVKQDSTTATTAVMSQFGSLDAFYILDDYNRFPEMHEHFIEFIPGVIARKNKNRSKVKVILKYFVSGEKDPLILMDGVPVTAEGLLDFNPYKVESIGVINNRVFVGSLVADGLVSVQTFDGDLMDYPLDAGYLGLMHQGLEPERQYQFPAYDTDALNRIPDYREQLFWDPQVSASQTHQLSFYTSDVSGTFEVAVDGFTNDGQPVSIQKYFKVSGENSVK